MAMIDMIMIMIRTEVQSNIQRVMAWRKGKTRGAGRRGFENSAEEKEALEQQQAGAAGARAIASQLGSTLARLPKNELFDVSYDAFIGRRSRTSACS